MGLGLVVGVAALGVISARVGRRAAPADRRAARDRLPQADGAGAFLLESSFIALTAIVVGTGSRARRRLQRDRDSAPTAELGRT